MTNNENLPDGPKSYLPPELIDMYKLGQAGKLWTIEIIYVLDGETKVEKKRNLRRAEVMLLREDIFKVGFLIGQTTDCWRVITPLDIDKVFLHRQSGYFSG